MNYLQQYPIIIPFIVTLLAEATKASIDMLLHRKRVRFVRTGGMPSGHSAAVSSLVVVVAFHRGIESIEFTIAAMFALIVMYDAIFLRYEVGFHAKEINRLNPKAQLEESLGHNHWEVLVGATFGAVISAILLII